MSWGFDRWKEHQSDLRMSYWGKYTSSLLVGQLSLFSMIAKWFAYKCVCVCNLHFTINFAYTVPGEIRNKEQEPSFLQMKCWWSEVTTAEPKRCVHSKHKLPHTPMWESIYEYNANHFSFRHAHTHTEFFLLFPYSVLSFLSLFVHSLRTIPVNGSNGRKHINSTWLLPHTQEHKGRRKDVVFVTHSRIYSRIQKGGPSPIYSHTKYTSHISPPPKKNTNNTRAQEMRQCVTLHASLHASLVNGRIHTYIHVKVSQR